MTATAHMRGHKVYYDEVADTWCYSDNDEPAQRERPCTHCGELPTLEGYDPCLGFVPGAVSACCGHGVEEPYVMWDWRKRPLRWVWDRLGIAVRNNFQRTSDGAVYLNFWLVAFVISSEEVEIILGR